MPFTVSDFQDLLEILQQHPEWRARLLETLLGEEFLALPQQMHSLIQAQQRTEEQLAALTAEVRQLAEAQRRTGQQVEELAEAQKRLTEEFATYRVQTDQAIRELAEAQRRTHEEFVAYRSSTDLRLDELSREFKAYRESTDRRLNEISRELKNLSARVGMTLEEEAEDMVWWVLKEKGYRFSEARQAVVFDGELDVVLIGETPDGESITVLVESKTRLGRREVHAWAQRVRSEGFRKRLGKAGLHPPYIPYFFAMRADPVAVEEVKRAGIGLVTPRGEIVEGTLVIR